MTVQSAANTCETTNRGNDKTEEREEKWAATNTKEEERAAATKRVERTQGQPKGERRLRSSRR